MITIIILLILAGISIAQLTGNGLFEKAKIAKEESKNAQEDEENTLEEYKTEILKNTRDNISEERIREIIKEELQEELQGTQDTGTWVLLGQTTGTSTITIPDGKNITDYKSIALQTGASNYIYDVNICSAQEFKSLKGFCITYHNVATLCDVSYVSDTSVRLANYGSGRTVKLWGIK